MKRTSFLLASLTAIILLSCSNDNSSPLAEDVNYSPLQKVSPSIPLYELQGIDPGQSTINGTTGTYTVFNCGSMSISGIPYGATGWSSKAICDFTNLPKNSWNISYQFIGSGPTGNGSFSTQYAEIVCGNWTLDIAPLSYANISTTLFATGGDEGPSGTSTPANVKCSLRFYGKCNGTGSGGTACSLSVSNIKGTQVYTY